MATEVILGILSAVVGVGLLLLWFQWLGSCERCGSLFGPHAVSKAVDKNPIESVVRWRCRECGHSWDVTHSHLL